MSEDPILGDWVKTVVFAGTVKCRFLSNGTGIAVGKVFGHSFKEPFLWENCGECRYHIKAHGEEHDIFLRCGRLETVFRGVHLDMERILPSQ